MNKNNSHESLDKGSEIFFRKFSRSLAKHSIDTINFTPFYLYSFESVLTSSEFSLFLSQKEKLISPMKLLL